MTGGRQPEEATISRKHQDDLGLIARLNRRILRLVMMSVPVYLSFQLIGGDQGLLNYYVLEQEKIELEKGLALIRDERQQLEWRVKHLQNESLDIDLLEEQAKSVLGYALPGEQLLLLEQE